MSNGVMGDSNTPVLQQSSEVLMQLFSTYHLKRWVEENKEIFSPPFITNRLLVHHKDFLVMILRGPNVRLDFHVEPGDEFFYQIQGDIELHLKPADGRRK